MKADKHHRTLGFVGATLGALLLSNVAIAAPWVSAPSSDRAGDSVPVHGGGMPPGAQLELSLLDGQGQQVGSFSVEADATGNFTLDVPLSGDDGYLLEVYEVGSGTGDPAAFMHLVPGSGQ